MAKVLVTGANGFVGSHLTEKLIEKGHKVRALVRKTANLQWIKDLPIEISYGAICDYDTLPAAVDGIDYIMHVAGATKGKTEKDYEYVNVDGTKNLLKACLEKNPNLKRFVFFSTLAVTGSSDKDTKLSENTVCIPVSIYGKTKLQAELTVLEAKDKIPSIILRLCAIFGPRDTETLAYFKFLKAGIRPTWDGTVSSCYIKDAVSAAILCLEKNIESGTIYHISDGKCYTIDDIATIAEQVIGNKTLRVKLPTPIMSLYGKIVHTFSDGNTVLGPDKIKELTQSCWVCDITKAQRELGFVPRYTLEQGLKETITWYKEQKWL